MKTTFADRLFFFVFENSYSARQLIVVLDESCLVWRLCRSDFKPTCDLTLILSSIESDARIQPCSIWCQTRLACHQTLYYENIQRSLLSKKFRVCDFETKGSTVALCQKANGPGTMMMQWRRRLELHVFRFFSLLHACAVSNHTRIGSGAAIRSY